MKLIKPLFASICLLLILVLINRTHAQQNLKLWDSTGSKSILFESNDRIGLGTKLPSAQFHVVRTGYDERPMFQMNILRSLGDTLGGISFLSQRGQINFGIRQTTVDIPVINYFQSPVVIGNALYTADSSSQGVLGDILSYFFAFKSGSGPTQCGLTIDRDGIFVPAKTRTNQIQLLSNAGFGKVLVSDTAGNGTWTDASMFHDDDWLSLTPHGDTNRLATLYLNEKKYGFVGIGTSLPMQKLHVVDGNILLSRQPSENPCSLNGSILFGDVPSSAWPNGEWGIEYYNGGLNFWKVAADSSSGANYCLFLKNDATVGIGTEVTHNYKLAVSGKILCEELKVKLVDEWPDYVFSPEHKLRSLEDLDLFIRQNNRLPDVPSAKEVEQNGISVGEMNAILLKKVEELTVYIISMQKEMEQLKAKVASR